jgi:Uma2 family endonuclease
MVMSPEQGTAGLEFAAAAPVPLVAGLRPVRRFSVDEYHRMIEAGILTENDRVELVDGWIVEMSPIGPPHTTCVSLIFAALQEILPAGWSVRTQSPITLMMGEPEPDVTVMRGGLRDYSDHHPTGGDVSLVVEVADTSLEFDRGQKKRLYAAAGIAEYWILNLIERKLELFRVPAATGDYREHQVFGSDATIDVVIAGTIVGQFVVADLLP